MPGPLPEILRNIRAENGGDALQIQGIARANGDSGRLGIGLFHLTESYRNGEHLPAFPAIRTS